MKNKKNIIRRVIHFGLLAVALIGLWFGGGRALFNGMTSYAIVGVLFLVIAIVDVFRGSRSGKANPLPVVAGRIRELVIIALLFLIPAVLLYLRLTNPSASWVWDGVPGSGHLRHLPTEPGSASDFLQSLLKLVTFKQS